MARAAKHCTEILIKVSGTEDTLVEINKLGVTIMESVINSGKFLINEENEIYFGKQKQNNKPRPSETLPNSFIQKKKLTTTNIITKPSSTVISVKSKMDKQTYINMHPGKTNVLILGKASPKLQIHERINSCRLK